ncbi:hypothetical protein HDU83_009918 [Entophlyctis luteolus]|nr:hypothetical protein HDU83_009918 [Entophlyctis luteolus]KAJ3392288.1 hypothetical protein HDU84_004553 [Entophlyctis sp. JEL0112]
MFTVAHLLAAAADAPVPFPQSAVAQDHASPSSTIHNQQAALQAAAPSPTFEIRHSDPHCLVMPLPPFHEPQDASSGNGKASHTPNLAMLSFSDSVPSASAHKKLHRKSTRQELKRRRQSTGLAKPPNSWILYRQAKQAELDSVGTLSSATSSAASHTRLGFAETSKLIAAMWREEPPEVKRTYEMQAMVLRAKFEPLRDVYDAARHLRAHVLAHAAAGVAPSADGLAPYDSEFDPSRALASCGPDWMACSSQI